MVAQNQDLPSVPNDFFRTDGLGSEELRNDSALNLGNHLLSFVRSFLLIAFTLVTPLQIFAQVQNPGTGLPQSIELGDAIVLPGSNVAKVPVLISSEAELQSWQMGLEYDELLLSLVEIEFTDTLSAPLDPILSTQSNGTNLIGFQVTYPGPDFFPTGESQRAAFLVFEVGSVLPSPPTSGTEIPIGIVDLEALPVSMTATGGLVISPETQSGNVIIHDFPLYLIEKREVSLLEGTALVPLRAWSQKSAFTFTMGLEYDELLLTQFIVSNSDLDDITGGSWTLTAIPTATGMICTIECSTPLPPLNGETLGFLQIQRPGNQPGEPGWGPLSLRLDEANCLIGDNVVTSLQNGNVAWLPHFIRGDANLDSDLNIADAETILGALHLGQTLDCEDAADCNDDGNLDISDVVSVLQFLFSGSPSPPAPYPDPGGDPTDDGLNCE
ncbi:MAG: hypothetical protein CBC13_07380 [Planctomycetia bacterium TMED53]|nr:MAG: hypothetical protein CBC13_07380 [Planctomycetia bacterium TMED53]